MAGGWSLLKATRSRQRLQKACWGSQEVGLLPGRRRRRQEQQRGQTVATCLETAVESSELQMT